MIDKRVYDIAKEVRSAGGRAFFVGGYVRDKLLGIDNKDIDIEVHGISEDKLKEILKNIGKVKEFGKSFGIYTLTHSNIDIALPRSDISTGKGHNDYKIIVDPFIGYKQASRRRDFSINALMQDILSEEILDYYNGQDDLKNKIIRHVDPSTFIEDPLRVFRAAQFASRFNFKVDTSTIDLCKTIDVSVLSKERVFDELKKALLKSNKPSIFFDVLKDCNQLNYWFKEIEELIGLKQDSIYHPEGDAYIHSMQVLDRSTNYKDLVSNQLYFELLALTHDLGKIETTQIIDNRIHSYKHEIALDKMNSLIKRLTSENDLYHYLKVMIPLHMKANIIYQDNSSEKASNKLFDEAINPNDIIYFALSDKINYDDDKRLEFFKERLTIYNELMSKPYVTGDDLIKVGIKKDKRFKIALQYAHKLRLSGVNKESALKQTIEYTNNNC